MPVNILRGTGYDVPSGATLYDSEAVLLVGAVYINTSLSYNISKMHCNYLTSIQTTNHTRSICNLSENAMLTQSG